MNEEEIKLKFSKGIENLQELEIIVKGLESTFQVHLDNIALLQFFVERITELRDLELGSLEASDYPPLNEPRDEVGALED